MQGCLGSLFPMSRRANHTVIGLFVIGGLILAVGTLIFFGSFKFFSAYEEFICYFDEPVSGLDIGSPVKFRGVKIGSVKEIFLRFNQGDQIDHIPVVIQLDLAFLNSSLGVDVDIRDNDTFSKIISLGYRAKLVTESFITGLRYIEIDIVLDAEQPKLVQDKVIYKEIPTVPSLNAQLGQNVEEVFVRLGALDIPMINDELIRVLKNVREGLEEVDFGGVSELIKEASHSTSNFLESPELRETITAIRETVNEFQLLATKLNSRFDTVLAEAGETNEELQRMLKQVGDTTSKAEYLFSSESSFRYRIEDALAEVTEAAEAIRILVNYLERNPNSLLRGKSPKEN